MSRIATKCHALRLYWPLGSGREFILPLFAVGRQLCWVDLGSVIVKRHG